MKHPHRSRPSPRLRLQLRHLAALLSLALGSSAALAQTEPPPPQPATPPASEPQQQPMQQQPMQQPVVEPAQPRMAPAAMPASRNSWTRDGSEAGSYSILPYTRQGYIGLNLGRARFDLPCGSGGYGCDRSANRAVTVYTGGMFNDWWGLELGYFNSGKADRAGGQTRAEALNASLVGRLPMGGFHAFAKGGVAYGRARMSTGPLSDQPSGRARGRGWVYGAGLGADITKNSSLVLEWTRYRLWMGRGDRSNVDATQLGYVYRF